MTGGTFSVDFPTTVGAFDTTFDRTINAFVVKLAFTPKEQINGAIDDLQDIIDGNPGPLADKVQDAQAKARIAFDELCKTPPDNQAAAGNIEGAVGDLDAAISQGLDPAEAIRLMVNLAGVARQLAEEAIDEAIARGGDPVKIQEAQDALAGGDALRLGQAFKDAAAQYKDAIAKAEGA